MKILWARFVRLWWHIPVYHYFGSRKPRLPRMNDCWRVRDNERITLEISCECGKVFYSNWS